MSILFQEAHVSLVQRKRVERLTGKLLSSFVLGAWGRDHWRDRISQMNLGRRKMLSCGCSSVVDCLANVCGVLRLIPSNMEKTKQKTTSLAVATLSLQPPVLAGGRVSIRWREKDPLCAHTAEFIAASQACVPYWTPRGPRSKQKGTKRRVVPSWPPESKAPAPFALFGN